VPDDRADIPQKPAIVRLAPGNGHREFFSTRPRQNGQLSQTGFSLPQLTIPSVAQSDTSATWSRSAARLELAEPVK